MYPCVWRVFILETLQSCKTVSFSGWNMKLIPVLFLGVALSLSWVSSSAFAAGGIEVDGISNFGEVVEGKLYRGGQPTEAGFRFLQANGVKTVINLISESEYWVAQEKQWVEEFGMRSVHIPLSALFFTPSDEQINMIQTILNDEAQQPVFMHCAEGKDRTGLNVGIYRFKTQQWPAEEAWKEMKKFGFHWECFWLFYYFKKVTGFDTSFFDDFENLLPG